MGLDLKENRHDTILGSAQFGMKSFKEAVVTFERAIKRNPGNEFPMIYLASTYGHLGRIDEADNIIEQANNHRDSVGLGDLSLVENVAYAATGQTG